MSVEDVSGKLRVMGQVPTIPPWASRSPRAAKSQKGRFWHDMMTESVDAARTLLVHDAEQEEMRIIMVVSAMPSEGKTTLSCHLASSLARSGRKVVLVDCDMRRPNVHRAFSLSNEAGFCEVLLGKKELDDVIQTTPAGGPAILSAGRLTPSVPPLLGTEAVEQVFRDSEGAVRVRDCRFLADHDRARNPGDGAACGRGDCRGAQASLATTESANAGGPATGARGAGPRYAGHRLGQRGARRRMGLLQGILEILCVETRPVSTLV